MRDITFYGMRVAENTYFPVSFQALPSHHSVNKDSEEGKALGSKEGRATGNGVPCVT